MAQKRMFDKAIIDTDRFMDLAMSAKALYFLLGMEADDEGFVSYKKVMRVHGGNEDDIKVLVAKKFLISFHTGVVVITDWNKNNWLDSRRSRETEYKKEKKMLILTPSKEYELSNGLESIEESSIEEKSIYLGPAPEAQDVSKTKDENKSIAKVIDLFKIVNENYKSFFGHKTQRKAVKELLEKHSEEEIEKYIYLAKFSTNNQYFSHFISPYELQIKWSKIDLFWQRKQVNDKRYLLDFEKWYADIVKSRQPVGEKKVMEVTIGGKKITYEFNGQKQ